MTEADGEALHPGPVELAQYSRGGLDRGHAVAILAHAAVCGRCGRLLATMAAASLPSLPGLVVTRLVRRTGDDPAT